MHDCQLEGGLRGNLLQLYNNLYKAQKEVFGQTKLKRRVLDSMSKIFTQTMNFKLTQPIVAKSMTRGQAPEPNGIVLDFYIFNGT
jgi:hypothetical protein